ncbi:PREDICTED: uncharacterized protein LOC109469239 [Branchiostoma belcheri]|uniref:Uncharacterized protein LOC109469239 n=1 Tax=Branchiostoma belcheri TaxID=7741 RepID=A0A6P4YX18_BRABE|nr:PREDICTED: uncharacterized protein LOC109469239 [Branchiostoma belcheri]
MASGESQTIIESNTNTTPTLATNDNVQTTKGQSQAITQSLDIGNLLHDALLAALQPNPMYVGAKSPPKDPASTEIASGHDQTEQGQGQSQARPEASDMINPMCDALLAALQANPMYVGVNTLSKDPASTEIASGYDQIGQGQSQTNTVQSLDIRNLLRDALFSLLQSNPMYVDVKTLPKDPASADLASGHDQTGQGQSQDLTQSFNIGNLPRDALLAALQPNLMYESAKTSPKDQTSTEIASGHDQTGQGQYQSLIKPDSNTTGAEMANGSETGQGLVPGHQ